MQFSNTTFIYKYTPLVLFIEGGNRLQSYSKETYILARVIDRDVEVN
jgi:hypothetical protein